jgi:hypothetical protein
LFTGIGWYSNQIMPDFFTPVFILLIFLLLYNTNISFIKMVLYSILIIYSLIVHFSHFLIVFILIILVIGMNYLFSKKLNVMHKQFHPKRLLVIIGLIISAWIILPSINYLIENKFIMSKGSHAFIMAHLVDTGLLEQFLNEKCSTNEFKDCKLCIYKDHLPTGLATFLWESNGPFSKMGEWLESEKEYNKIIYGMLNEPKYVLWNIYKSFVYGCDQLFKNEIGQGLSAYNEGSAPYGQIHWRFHNELNNYLNARQNLWNGITLDLKALNSFNFLLNIISLFSMIFIFFTPLWKKINIMSLNFLLFSIIAIIINGFVTAGLNSPCERFQARVVWLLPFALIIILITNIEIIKKYISSRD